MIKDEETKLATVAAEASTSLAGAAAADSTAAGLLTQAQQIAGSVGASC